jgi:glucose/arabinose dehydrogenase
MRVLSQLIAILLVIILAACSNEATPTPTDSRPLMAFESPLPPLPSPLSTQVTVSEPAPSGTALPDITGTVASSETPTDIPQPTDTSEDVTTVTNLPDPAAFTWTQVSGGLQNPVGLAHAGDRSGRLFILEQEGRIRILQDGELLPQAFLDISERVVCCGERGLLGIAFHPNYTQNGYFYINYTELQGQQLTSVIARYQASADANAADPNSEVRILEQPQPYNNHNGGGLEFGPDGFLYIGLGDGGSAGDPQGNAQSLDTWLGKLLRIAVDSGEPYTIPVDNPFVQGGGLPEIWAYGLRNPWRFSFDHLSGDLYIGDVGQGSWEEIDFLPAGSLGGANFGWDYYEGAHPYEGSPPSGLAIIDPVAEYSHSLGISVTGGYVYRGSKLSEWQGVYLYGDYGSGNIWGLLRRADGTWENSLLFQTNANITSFGVDERGEIYLVDYRGNILRLDQK